MDMSTKQKLQMYIDAELRGAALYQALSEKATDMEDRQLLLELADDEQSHAEEFQNAYRKLSGRRYTPDTPTPEIVGLYRDILRDRVLDESGDFLKYGQDYENTGHNDMLRSAYYRAHLDEGVHAMRLLSMLTR